MSGLICFIPLLVSIIFGLWPPLAMVHEVSGANYFTYFFNKIVFYFTETGHGSLVFTSNLAAAISEFIADGSLFNKLYIFSLIFYFIVGILKYLIFVLSVNYKFTNLQLFSMLFIPIAPILWERETNLNLIINYNHSQELVALIVIFFIVFREMSLSKEITKQFKIIVGIIIGLICSIKFSNIIVFCPLLITLIIDSEMKKNC